MSSFSKPIVNKPTLAVSTDPWELLTPSPSGLIVKNRDFQMRFTKSLGFRL
jgi:hypothetical protein